jgi:hypothetical protein
MRHSKILVLSLLMAALTCGCRWANSGGSSRRPAVADPVAPNQNTTNTNPSSTTTTSSSVCASFSNLNNCSAVVGCAWTGTNCILASTSTTSTTSPNTGSTTTNPGTATNNYCTPLTTSILCAAGPGCLWDGTACKIVGQAAAPQPSSCTPFTTPELCSAGLNCYWTGKICHRPSVGLGTPFRVGDGLSNIGTGTSQFVNCNFSALMGADGNFTVYQGSSAIWSTKTAGKGGTNMQFLGDGNLVMYPATGTTALWSSATANRGAVGLLLSPSGTLVIVDANGRAIWTSGITVPVCR